MKIGIITYHRAINFGTVLQAFALQRSVQLLQGDTGACNIIDYRCIKIEEMTKLIHWDKRLLKDIFVLPIKYKHTKEKIKKFQKFRSAHLCIDKNSNIPFKNIESEYDVFITGSDQLWNYDVCGDDDTYFLNFINKDEKKFSYAASFGTQKVFNRDKERIINNLMHFPQISIREEIGVEDLKKSGIKYRLDIDPTLLIEKTEWEKIIDKTNPYGHYILIYNVQPPKMLMEYARKLGKQTGLKIIYLTDWIHSRFKYRDFSCLYGQGPEDFVNLIYHAQYVLTTSFHGTAFSVIFHKKFYSEIDNLFGHNDRIAHLLDSLGMQDYYDSKQIGKIPYNDAYWADIDERLSNLHYGSLDYLRSIVTR